MLGKLQTGELKLSEEADNLRYLAKCGHEGGTLLLDAADRLDRMEVSSAAMVQLLKRLEWSSFTQGQGSGYMSSGGDGPWIPTCPICRNVHPEKGKGDFIAEALGHKPDCELRKFLETGDKS
jgi:hypothetical protein